MSPPSRFGIDTPETGSLTPKPPLYSPRRRSANPIPGEPLLFTPKRLKVYLAALLILQVFTWINGSGLLRDSYIDFRTFYTAGYMVRTGHAAALYDYQTEQQFQNQLVSPADRALPMMCPPYTALLFVPFSLLPFHSAYVAFLLLNLALLLLSAASVSPYLNALQARLPLASYALWLSFLPACIAILMGQLSLIVLLLFCLCFQALRRGRPILAGVLLSLALVKFQIALPVALLFLLWRQLRFFTGFLAGAAVLTALSAAIVGPHSLLPYLASVLHMTASITTDRSLQAHFAILPSQMPNLYGLFFTLTSGSRLTTLLTLLASLAVLTWTARRPPSLSRAILAGLLVSYHLFLYDLTTLLLPLGLLLNQLLLEDAPAPSSQHTPIPQKAPALARRLTFAATAILLIAPIERLLIATSALYLLSIPILVLTILGFDVGGEACQAPNPAKPAPVQQIRVA